MPIFKPKDFIAAIVIAAYVFLKVQGFDSALDPALFLILGYYFVKRENGSDNGE